VHENKTTTMAAVGI